MRRLIRDEGMPGEPEQYEVCPHCRRIYDWRWFSDDRPFRREWELLDRPCACGCDLSRPALIVDTNKLKTALREIRPEVLGVYGTDVRERRAARAAVLVGV